MGTLTPWAAHLKSPSIRRWFISCLNNSAQQEEAMPTEKVSLIHKFSDPALVIPTFFFSSGRTNKPTVWPPMDTIKPPTTAPFPAPPQASPGSNNTVTSDFEMRGKCSLKSWSWARAACDLNLLFIESKRAGSVEPTKYNSPCCHCATGTKRPPRPSRITFLLWSPKSTFLFPAL